MRLRCERYEIGTAMTSFGDVTAKNWKTKTTKTAKTAQKKLIISLVSESYIKVGEMKTRKIMMFWYRHLCNAFFAFDYPNLKKNDLAETRDYSELMRALRIWTRDLQIFSLTLSQLSYLGNDECFLNHHCNYNKWGGCLKNTYTIYLGKDQSKFEIVKSCKYYHKVKKIQKCSKCRKLVILRIVSSCYCFGARLGALFLLFVPLSSQRVSSNSCETLREQLTDPTNFTKLSF